MSVLKMATTGLLLLGCCLMLQSSHAELIYKFWKIDCQTNPARLQNASCHVKAINWNLAVANMDGTLVVPLRNPDVRMQVFKKDYSNQYKPFLVDVTANVCEIIERKNYIPYGVILWKHMKKYTNANHSCPFSGQLTARDAQLDVHDFPPFPQGIYALSFSFTDINSTKNQYVGTLKIYVESMERVKSKKKPRN